MSRLLIILVCSLVAIANAKSPHVYTLNDSPLKMVRPGGNMTTVSSKVFPILKNLSIRRLILQPLAIREPHWHANANELTYCLRGSALVTLFGNQGEHETFIITEGQMYFVPSGFLHYIENINSDKDASPAEFIIGFSNELPEDFDFSGAFAAMTDTVLGNTYQLPTDAWKGIVKRGEATIIGKMQTPTKIDDKKQYFYSNRYKFDIEKLCPALQFSEGSVKTGSKRYWPILEDISMFSLRITSTGMREPHWHPDTAEMCYIARGRVRLTIVSPNGDDRVDTYELKAGDVFYIPRAYPNDIENIGNEDAHILVFFDKAIPGEIGYSASFSAFSRETLAATLRCSVNELPEVPFYSQSAFVVKRLNSAEN